MAKNKPLSEAEMTRIRQSYDALVAEVKEHGVPDMGLLNMAFEYAKKKHGNTRRKNGDPYIIHPLEVASILAAAGLDTETVASALLHDVMEDCDVTYGEIMAEFGPLIADNVDAVTKVSLALVEDKEISRQELEDLTDTKLLSNIEDTRIRKALYIKCADRIHNLRTISVFPEEKRREKSEHTRRVLIPTARKYGLYSFARELSSLCLQVENPRLYREIMDGYKVTTGKYEDYFWEEDGFEATMRALIDEDSMYSKYVAGFSVEEFTAAEIFPEIEDSIQHYNDIPTLLTKERLYLYDIFFIVKDSFSGTPEDLFFHYYNSFRNSRFRFTITGIHLIDDYQIEYYSAEDLYGLRYRLFVQKETDHLEKMYGVAITDELVDFRSGKSSAGSAETGEEAGRMIKVHRKDGSAIEIRDGSTALDLAFAINPLIGICAKYAIINKGASQTPLYYKLQKGDRVEIISDHNKKDPASDIPHASLRWFQYLNSLNATRTLAKWLEKHPEFTPTKMVVFDESGKSYEIEMASTVLDFAFAVGKDVGLHLKKAFINQSDTEAAFDRVLQYGDQVRFVSDPKSDETAKHDWIKILKTKTARDELADYLKSKYEK